jgi:hypothetical protein
VSFLALPPTFLSYTQAGILTSKLSYEELNFKFTTFLSYEARNPCLRIGDVIASVFFFVYWFVGRFGRAAGHTHSLPSLGLSVGRCGLAMCVAVSKGII